MFSALKLAMCQKENEGKVRDKDGVATADRESGKGGLRKVNVKISGRRDRGEDWKS